MAIERQRAEGVLQVQPDASVEQLAPSRVVVSTGRALDCATDYKSED